MLCENKPVCPTGEHYDGGKYRCMKDVTCPLSSRPFLIDGNCIRFCDLAGGYTQDATDPWRCTCTNPDEYYDSLAFACLPKPVCTAA